MIMPALAANLRSRRFGNKEIPPITMLRAHKPLLVTTFTIRPKKYQTAYI
ncbi:hypothetical protein CH46_4383 (plasmid) [Yersinia pestis]|nr:hypothetical protein CH59_4425 [Yersinia pestis]AJJ12901.1 hypothetical protein CH46_4383 [Yersinia pestis]AJJ29763.1 hypothetical protein CH61_4309 [Yersinia pestis]AJJ38092.1 hypothetical protein CH62_4237 [Yersinia pestis]AJJ86360.1 hypothetical protein AK38_4278 [Yersinia pestis CO92]